MNQPDLGMIDRIWSITVIYVAKSKNSFVSVVAAPQYRIPYAVSITVQGATSFTHEATTR